MEAGSAPVGQHQSCAQRFDPLFSILAQRRGFRDYLQGLLLPRDPNKTLAGAEPIAGDQHRDQRLQWWFLTESSWDHEVVSDRRVRLWCEDPATTGTNRLQPGPLLFEVAGAKSQE